MEIKTIKDPIHGFIHFEGEFENKLRKILDDPFFLRLRKVKQLGFSDHIFPSATHTRFSHSLGVYAVARRMLKVVDKPKGPGEWSEKGKACLAAALLHDVGHGMFSHAFENAMKDFVSSADLNSEKKEALSIAVNHEKVSARIIQESSISVLLREIGGAGFPKLVSDMVGKKDDSCVYTSIVSGQLDADRLDYILRDPYFAGVSSGQIDLDWIIRNIKCAEDKSFLYFDSKAYISMEQFTVSLFQLYPTIYLHKKTRGLERMFSKMLSRVFELISKSQYSEAGIQPDHPFVAFFSAPSNLNNSLLLDDTVLWGSMYQFRAAPDTKVQKLAAAISNRKIDQSIDIWSLADEIYSELGLGLTHSAKQRVGILNHACPSAYKVVKKEYPELIAPTSYDKASRVVYKPSGKKGGKAQQINIRIGDEYVDVFQMSPIVASSASFHIHRLYYDADIYLDASKLKEQLRKALKDTLLKLKFAPDLTENNQK
jgi:HD superfamily phosphohydrolase